MHSRSSRPEVLCKKGALRNFAKFTEKRFCQTFFFKKVAGLKGFSCKFCEISKTTFCYRTTSGGFVTEHQLLAYKGRVDPYIGSYQTLMRELFAKVVKHF